MIQRARSLRSAISPALDGRRGVFQNGEPRAPSGTWPHRTRAIEISTALALFAIGGAGCLARTVVGDTNDGGSGGSGSSSVASTVTVGVAGPSSSTGPAPTPSAVALMTSELPPNALPCGFNPCTPPADMLFIELTSLGNNSCSVPIPGLDLAGNDWIRQIGIPAKYQQVGTYSMMDQAIDYSGGENFVSPTGSGAATSSGGMGSGGGTIEIVSIDDTSIHIRLQGTALNYPNEDGDFIAQRCTPLP